MSNAETPPPTAETPPKPFRLFRVGFPQVVSLLCAAVWLGIHTWPQGELEGMWRTTAKMLPILLGSLLIAIWLLFNYPRIAVRVALVLIVVVGGGLAVGNVKFDGDMHAGFQWRRWVLKMFDRTPEALLAKERAAQQGAIEAPANAIDLTETPGDVPSFRGKNRDGVIAADESLDFDWAKRLPPELWRQRVGEGFSSFTVVNGFLFTMEQRGDEEGVVCYEAATGRERWAKLWSGRFSEPMGGPGPRSTPTVDHGDVFAFGAEGKLVCLEGESGNVRWEVETLKGKNNANLMWAMSGSPLVVDDLVIVNPGEQRGGSEAAQALVAFDRNSGEERWHAGDNPAGYSSPMLAKVAGETIVLLFDGKGLAGYEVATGKELWRVGWRTQQGINVAQPLVMGEGLIFIASGYGVGGGLVEVTKDAAGAWKASVISRTERTMMRAKFSSPVHQGNVIYGLNDGVLECVEIVKTADGETDDEGNKSPVAFQRRWKDDRGAAKGKAYGHGSLLLVKDHLLILSEFGELVLVKATPERFEEVGRFQAVEGRTWNNLAFAHGMVYVRNETRMACFDLRATK